MLLTEGDDYHYANDYHHDSGECSEEDEHDDEEHENTDDTSSGSGGGSLHVARQVSGCVDWIGLSCAWQSASREWGGYVGAPGAFHIQLERPTPDNNPEVMLAVPEVALGNSFVVVAQCVVPLHTLYSDTDTPATAGAVRIRAPRWAHEASAAKLWLGAEHDVVSQARSGDIARVYFVPGGNAVSVSIECFRLMLACTGAHRAGAGDAPSPPGDWDSFADPYMKEAAEEMTAAAAMRNSIADAPALAAAFAFAAEYLDERKE